MKVKLLILSIIISNICLGGAVIGVSEALYYKYGLVQPQIYFYINEKIGNSSYYYDSWNGIGETPCFGSINKCEWINSEHYINKELFNSLRLGIGGGYSKDITNNINFYSIKAKVEVKLW